MALWLGTLPSSQIYEERLPLEALVVLLRCCKEGSVNDPTQPLWTQTQMPKRTGWEGTRGTSADHKVYCLCYLYCLGRRDGNHCWTKEAAYRIGTNLVQLS